MFLICLYLLVLIIIIILVFYSRNEGFQNSLEVSQPVSTTTAQELPPTTSSFNDMETIDFDIIENSEKILRDDQSEKLNDCLGKYVNRQVKPMRDVTELMFNHIEDCENIFEATEVDNKRKYFEQMSYW